MLQLVRDSANTSQNKKTDLLTKFITLVICLFPILSIYRAVSIFMLSEVVALIALFLILIVKKEIPEAQLPGFWLPAQDLIQEKMLVFRTRFCIKANIPTTSV